MKKSILLLIAAFAALVTSAHDFEVGGIYYNITSEEAKQAEVTFKGDYSGQYDGYSGSITLPATVTHNGVAYSVTSIGYSAFEDCSSLTHITLPEGVTSIGSYAFFDCSSLTSITIPEGVTSIGNYAFSYCSSLTAITIPEGVTSIGNVAFSSCESLTSVYISNIEAWCNIDFKDNHANPLYYNNNSSLYLNGELVTELTIPNTVAAIKSYAFAGCSSLTSITLPESVTSIGEWAFYDCSSLTSINIPEGVTSIGYYAFYGCIYNHRTTKTNQKYPSVNL